MYVYWKKSALFALYVLKQKNVILFKKNIYMDVSDIFICIQYITLSLCINLFIAKKFLIVQNKNKLRSNKYILHIIYDIQNTEN